MATLIAEIKVDAAMLDALAASTARRLAALLRKHAREPDTHPEVAAWVDRATAVIEKEFEIK